MHYKEGISISSAIVVASSYFLVSLLVYLEFGLVSDPVWIRFNIGNVMVFNGFLLFCEA
jgi:hypothetical protein